jgi:chemotaxis protein MotB
MKRTLMICAAIVVMAMLQTGCTSKSHMNKEIAARESKITDLQSDIAKQKSEIEAQEAQINDKDKQITDLQSEIDGLKTQVGKKTEDVDQLNTDLQKALGNLQSKEKLWLKEKAGMSTITMPNAATFGSGSTALTAEGKAIIDTVWTVLSRYPDRDIFIEGHTDSIPIGPGLRDRFSSNWALSAARAVSVLQYVLQTHNTEGPRLAAVGYGEYQPVATNSTEEGRALNRRVVISVRPKPMKKAEAQAMKEPAGQ